MNKNIGLQHILELNLALICISTSGALGRYIDMPVPITIGLRACLGGIFIFIFCKWKGFNFKVAGEDRRMIFLGGILMALHWITYFYSLKLSNVAIGMLSLFTYPVITAFLEPLLLKTKFQKMHLLLGALVLFGIYFLVPDFNFENDYSKAIGLGVFSATCYALRNIIMKSKVNKYNGSIMMFYQLLIITICLSPFFLFLDTSGILPQFPANLTLALVTTAIGHTLFLYSFKHFSTTSVSIISSAQPIYGIIIGMILLKEYPSMNAIIGGSLILLSVVLESMRSLKK
ncbi:DMT family transporter [Namhaeicola litoreus]|uniref:DMT family transporter n=1 Tax=Namhaeicola litoreus TaxID=1052145 RepID=A0ABW3Y587_9FLAO